MQLAVRMHRTDYETIVCSRRGQMDQAARARAHQADAPGAPLAMKPRRERGREELAGL